MTGPIGADAVPPARPSPLAWARLVRLRLRRRIRIDGPVWIGPRVRIEIGRDARVVLGAGCVLHERARIEAVRGEVRIGPRTALGERSTIVALAGVTIGSDCVLGEHALIVDADPGYDDVERPIQAQPPQTAPVRLGDRVRIGAHAAVLAGATLGDGAVAGSYAVVRARVPAGAAVKGSPAT